MNRHLLRQTGDTLVEVVMSIAILALTLLTSYNIANASYGEGLQAREQTQAVYLAQDQAEKLRFYRDYLVAQDPTEASSNDIFVKKKGIFKLCNAGAGCHMEVASATNTACGAVPAGTPCILTGPVPAAESQLFNGVQYTVLTTSIGANAVGGAVPPYEGQFQVVVTWTPAIAAGVTVHHVTTEQDTVSLNVILSDPRGITPRDCSVVGSRSCS